MFFDFRSGDQAEIQSFQECFFPGMKFKFIGKTLSPRVRSFGYDLGDVAQASESSTSGFRFECYTKRDSFLINSYTAGSARLSLRGGCNECTQEITDFISPSDEFTYEGNAFANTTTLIRSAAIEALCAKWLGSALHAPVLFEGVSLSNELKPLFDAAIWSLDELMQSREPSAIALNNLVTHMMSLILGMQPSNYSAHLLAPEISLSDRVVHDAQHYIRENAHRPITVSDIAEELGCKLIDLYKAFYDKLGLVDKA